MISHITRFSNFKNNPFIIRPKPYEDELLGSWLTRIAIAHHTLPWTFCNIHFPQYKNTIFSRDIDIWAPLDLIKSISLKSGIKADNIFSLTLKSYGGYLNEDITSATNNNLILPVTARKRVNNAYGQKFCPLCLRERTYFKKTWRLAFYGICHIHKCFMHDKCQNCGKPVSYYKFMDDNGFDSCWNCGFSFKKTKPTYIHGGSLIPIMLSRNMDILKKGYFQINEKPFYSISYFIVLKHIAKLIYQFGYRRDYTIENEQKIHGFKIKNKSKTKKRPMEETVSIQESNVIFTAAAKILSSIDELTFYIKSNKINFNLLKRDMPYIPFWYEKAICNFYKQAYYVTYKEAKNACKWMRKRGIQPSYLRLSKLLGVSLENRKRPELNSLIH